MRAWSKVEAYRASDGTYHQSQIAAQEYNLRLDLRDWVFKSLELRINDEQAQKMLHNSGKLLYQVAEYCVANGDPVQDNYHYFWKNVMRWFNGEKIKYWNLNRRDA